ncbi:MAG TPA: metallophosphoesterase, partial [Solirubrobacteraceae bacterium]|nr:metallophosphoesterase [Solirubrobacteraceae bacterium]
MRTLVVSDLHLGLRSKRDRLRDEDTLARLARELSSVDRLVLLGDVIELRQGPVREALGAAVPVLGKLREALGPDAEVVVVPGNHDHHLVGGWLARRGAERPPDPLGSESAVDWAPGEPLAALAGALGAERVRAAYPGVWLGGNVYATHGHYLDRHTTIPMFERLGAGAMAALLKKPATEAASAEDYEVVLGPIYAWLHASAQFGTPARGAHSDGASARLWRQLRRGAREGGWRRQALRVGFPVAIAAMNRAGLGPLGRDIDGASLRQAPLLALGEVVRRLGIDAGHVLFGHTHRAGPLPGDDAADWRTPRGTRLLNVGSWVHEPGFLGPTPAASPYRAGFAGRIDGDGEPELVNL